MERKQERRETAPALIVAMSLQLTIPGRVALQQSSLALRQLDSLCTTGLHPSIQYQRTVNPALSLCLTSGGRSSFACLLDAQQSFPHPHLGGEPASGLAEESPLGSGLAGRDASPTSALK